LFFNEQTEASLSETLVRFRPDDFNPRICRDRAEKFDVSMFQDNIIKKLESLVADN